MPVLWLDFPATRLRRDLTHRLRQHQIVIEPACVTLAMTLSKPLLITRDQQAHCRLTWAEPESEIQALINSSLTNQIVWNVLSQVELAYELTPLESLREK